MIKQQLEEDLKKVIQSLGLKTTDTLLSISQNPAFGDYTSNIALQQANQKIGDLKQSPLEIANKILSNLSNLSYLSKAEIKPPGFINFFIKDEVLVEQLTRKEVKTEVQSHPQKYLVEYAQPNTHKAFHIGHLRNISLGESLARLLEFTGNTVFRANYGSDIGLPVAKAIWGVKKLQSEFTGIKEGLLREKAEFLGKAYAFGAKAYEESEESNKEINELNKRIYQKDTELIPLWQETRQWSINYFNSIYQRLDTKFDRVFWESEVEGKGKQIVEENIGSVFVKDQGAIIFPGEKYGLHNRVFITSLGNPTYEAKEMWLTRLEEEAFPFDEALHVVGSEQADYFKVVFKVLELLEPRLVGREKHISYGMVNLSTGKMSSRTGEVVTAESLIDTVKTKVTEVMKESKLEAREDVLEKVAIGAVKFFMLKYSATSNITFDVERSVSLEGDSGPYVQYTYARTQSVLRNAGVLLESLTVEREITLEAEERALLRWLYYFREVAESAKDLFNPSILTEYLLDLAKLYNLFYQKHRIIQSDKKEFRLLLTAQVGQVLEKGLYLLGISAPERM